MKRVYVPTKSPDDWKQSRADPETQWRSGFSAKELAECWEKSDGFPPEFQELFTNSDNPILHKLEMLLAIPEHKVVLPGGKRPSQNDLFVLARAKDELLGSITVVGNLRKFFVLITFLRLKDDSNGKKIRLKFLCDVLGLASPPPSRIRYQLFHRTASAIIEAKRFNAKYAMMIVHSFSQEHKWLTDYQDFLSLFGVAGQINKLVELPNLNGVRVFAGWVTGKPKTGQQSVR